MLYIFQHKWDFEVCTCYEGKILLCMCWTEFLGAWINLSTKKSYLPTYIHICLAVFLQKNKLPLSSVSHNHPRRIASIINLLESMVVSNWKTQTFHYGHHSQVAQRRVVLITSLLNSKQTCRHLSLCSRSLWWSLNSMKSEKMCFQISFNKPNLSTYLERSTSSVLVDTTSSSGFSSAIGFGIIESSYSLQKTSTRPNAALLRN